VTTQAYTNAGRQTDRLMQQQQDEEEISRKAFLSTTHL